MNGQPVLNLHTPTTHAQRIEVAIARFWPDVARIQAEALCTELEINFVLRGMETDDVLRPLK
jgi:hypothetical protein